MRRVFTYRINKIQNPKKISGFLREQGFSAQNLTDLKKDAKSVVLNGIPVFQNVFLKEGDRLEIHLDETDCSDQIIPVKLPLEICYEDEDLLIINKPARMPIHPSLNNYDNTLGNALMWYFREQGKPFVYRCINRLDRDTSGLVIVAKNSVSAAILSSMISGNGKSGKKEIRREYLALVRGALREKQGVIDAPIAREESEMLKRCVDEKNGAPAVTHYRVLAEKNGFSLLSLVLDTGRTHQIRVHLKHIGHPLIGDYLYNPDMTEISRQALHAWRLDFLHPITKEPMHFAVPLPEDMQRVLHS